LIDSDGAINSQIDEIIYKQDGVQFLNINAILREIQNFSGSQGTTVSVSGELRADTIVAYADR